MTSVLLIEDDHRLAQMIVPYLTQYEFKVVHSASAQDAPCNILNLFLLFIFREIIFQFRFKMLFSFSQKRIFQNRN
ncbi:hypothetical protein SAMN05518863_10761 [Candidatus Pantoea symbiotica]|uniref:Response regulatory domain-containing protein n=1 Tax=Candidatus Pantoea symbiotica TaxID=1884370 RepID=A0A1I3ZJU5_9GAMM|nr:hypothetical protein SAMN05518863_10761 [Pantoea symbiotica]SFU93288.1 hypothetical protein SAMN05518864_107264 [Pantoea sp. YR525]